MAWKFNGKKTYGLYLNHLNAKLTDFNFMEVQYRAWHHGDSYVVDFHDQTVYRF